MEALATDLEVAAASMDPSSIDLLRILAESTAELHAKLPQERKAWNTALQVRARCDDMGQEYRSAVYGSTNDDMCLMVRAGPTSLDHPAIVLREALRLGVSHENVAEIFKEHEAEWEMEHRCSLWELARGREEVMRGLLLDADVLRGALGKCSKSVTGGDIAAGVAANGGLSSMG